MNHSVKIGFCFGSTSGIITTLGLMVGLNSGTHSKLVVIGGILTIAIADALSDALGIHISEESENKHIEKEIWQSTISTFLSKFFVAITFLAPILIFPLQTAVIISIIWGLSLLGLVSYVISSEQSISPWKAVFEHLFIALIVIGITYYVGIWIGATFRY